MTKVHLVTFNLKFVVLSSTSKIIPQTCLTIKLNIFVKYEASGLVENSEIIDVDDGGSVRCLKDALHLMHTPS